LDVLKSHTAGDPMDEKVIWMIVELVETLSIAYFRM
jgi:hypothetical protein